MIATICSSVNRPFRIAPSESGASLSTNRWSENPGAGQYDGVAGLDVNFSPIKRTEDIERAFVPGRYVRKSSLGT
jgi:hypothetical protein